MARHHVAAGLAGVFLLAGCSAGSPETGVVIPSVNPAPPGAAEVTPGPEHGRLKTGPNRGTLQSGGVQRTYLLQRPTTAPGIATAPAATTAPETGTGPGTASPPPTPTAPATPSSATAAEGARVPLVIALHGRGGDARGMRKGTRLGRFARDMLVAYPQGLDRHWDDGPGLARDVRFLRDLIDHLVRREGADPARVYLAGFSNGGGMALRFAADHPELVRGVVAVAAQLPPDITPRGPVPVLLIHGDRDPHRPLTALPSPGPGRTASIGVTATAEAFAKPAGARANTGRDLPDRDPHDGTTLRRTRWEGGRAPVELLLVRGGGHAWPGWAGSPRLSANGVSSRELDAGRRAIAFFRMTG
ncbi:alpha/beta hydrolase family esterase [Nonomuraea sp. NPDC050328]|uniref:alpha/beta hydrolase family esterase n=1 Tax=Nonomuraea sp. NPDC050328 TaxID=3364361 RepID=UPI0037A9E41E